MKEQFIAASVWRIVPPTVNTKKELKKYQSAYEKWIELRPLFIENLDLAFDNRILSKLDFSISSLKDLGEFIFQNHTRDKLLKGDNILFFDFCARYIGEVLIKNYQGVSWYISFNKKDFAYLTPAITQYLTEPLREISRLFSNELPSLLYDYAVHFEKVLEIDRLRTQSKFDILHFESYENVILISESSNFVLNDFFEKIKKALKHKNFKIEIESNKFYITIDSWVMLLAFKEDESIQEESQEMAEMMQDESKKKKIVTCSKRIDMIATDDPDMEYFNEHIYILDAAEEFSDVFIFNPYGGFVSS